ncbi:protein NLP2-like [Bidens hawaiensis]|uniref:protein NLP2-like n=1 Tax=Bidens hawaiensis TaxID=980011 RepID=UPI00404B79B8
MDNHTTIFGSMEETNLEYVVIDDHSPDGGWLEDFSSSYMTCFDPNISPEETDMKSLDDCHEYFDDRLIQAIEYLNERCMTETDLLVQLWLPVTQQGKRVLTSEDQPFIISSDSADLSSYREVSKSYKFAAEYDSTEMIGLPAVVYLKKFPTCTQDVQLVAESDPRAIYAQKFNLYGCLNIPVFDLDGQTCLGVIEVVTTSQKVNFRGELENISKALEAVDLRSSEFLIHPKLKDLNEPYEAALAEIRDVLRSICNTLNLPLAQTWGTCESRSIAIIESASYVFDPQVLGFFEAFSALQLVPGEGIAGKALGTNQPCFTDFSDFCRADYPAAHEAEMFGLQSAVAIRVHSTYTGSLDFILEFFLRRDCKSQQEQTRSSILYMLKNLSWSLHEIQDEELTDQASFSVKEPKAHDESWISDMLEAQRRGENVILSMGCHKEEPVDEYNVINQFCHGFTFSDPKNQTYLGWGSKTNGQTLTTKRSTEKGRSKTERNITLQVLQKYFPGSLKDAAKSIGVCPTTLKRICRQHGIMRWPSRKIKKVSHSLKKLQLVIDSVQGADGMIKLGSLYTNFPELASPVPTKPKVNPVNLLKSQATPTNSSSSGSRGSSCFTATEKLVHEETKLLVTSNNNKPKNMLQDEGVFRVKASYGHEKIRFKLLKNWGFGNLQQEIARRFSVYDVNSTIEYMDDDSEWVLLACDADLEECMDLHTSSKNQTVKLLIHQPSAQQSFVPMIQSNDDIRMW